MVDELVRVQPISVVGMLEEPLAGLGINFLYIGVPRVDLFESERVQHCFSMLL